MLKTKCTEPVKCKRQKLQLHSFCGRAKKEMASLWDRRELFLVRFRSGKPNNRQTASVRWWEVGGFAGIEVCEFGSKAAKSRNRMQRTQVRIRIQNVSAVYHWGQSQSSSEALTMPADSFFMLLLNKISFRCAAPLPPEEARLASVKQTPKARPHQLPTHQSLVPNTC